MAPLALRRSFVVLHLTLGIVVLVESVRTVMMSLHGHVANPFGSHLALIAGIEAIAALLFLIPRTLKAGSILLLIIFSLVVFVHGIQQELALLVYAAGVLFVSVHGSAFSKELLYTRTRNS